METREENGSQPLLQSPVRKEQIFFVGVLVKQNIGTFKHLKTLGSTFSQMVQNKGILMGPFSKVFIFNFSCIPNDVWLPWSQWNLLLKVLWRTLCGIFISWILRLFTSGRVSPQSGNWALTVDKTDPVIYSSANKISASRTLLTDGSQQVFSSTTCRRIFHCLPARRLDINCWRGIRKQIRTTCWCYLIPRYSHVLDFPLWNSPGSHCFPPQMRV